MWLALPPAPPSHGDDVTWFVVVVWSKHADETTCTLKYVMTSQLHFVCDQIHDSPSSYNDRVTRRRFESRPGGSRHCLFLEQADAVTALDAVN